MDGAKALAPMRLHLVDGTYELFRAHFSKRPDRRSMQGQDVKATAGIATSLIALLSDPSEAVTHLAVAFDNPIRSFRNDLFQDYKSDEGVAPELLAQFDLAEAAVRSLGIVVWSMDQWEADDAIATAAARWRGQVTQVRILSPDKDFGQCLDGQRIVQVDRRAQKTIDQASLLQRRGVEPESIPDYLALVGDTADGIPGLPGFGETSSSALLGAYRHLEDIPASARAWKCTVRSAETLAATLASHRQQALLYRRLATLQKDVPLQETLADLRHRGISRNDFEAWWISAGIEPPTVPAKLWR